MKTNRHFLSHLVQFVSEWEVFRTKVVQKIKTHILYSMTFSFSRNSFCLWDTVAKYRTVVQATDGNMASCVLHAGYLRLQTHTHNMQYLLLFHCNSGRTNAPECYVIRAMPGLFQLQCLRHTSNTEAARHVYLRNFFYM